MEEDIEKDLKNLMYTIEMHHISSEPIYNLIKRYKELEKEYKVLREYVDFAPNLDEMSATKYKEIRQSAYIEGRQDERNRAKEFIEETCIPKSKLQELRDIDNIDLIQHKLKDLLED